MPAPRLPGETTADYLARIRPTTRRRTAEEFFEALSEAWTEENERDASDSFHRASEQRRRYQEANARLADENQINEMNPGPSPPERKTKKMKRNRVRIKNGRPWIQCDDGNWSRHNFPASPFNLRNIHKQLRNGDFMYGQRERPPGHVSGRTSPTFGFELEGRWESTPDDFKGDCSVSFNMGDDYEDSDDYSTGEVASPIFRDENKINARRWLRENHPDEVNETCGLHVHLGGIDWPRFTKKSTDLYLAMVSGLKLNYDTKDRLYHRITGEGVRDDQENYCRPGIGYRNRYHHFNAGGAFNEFGTLEIRVLPMGEHTRETWKMIDLTQKFANRYWRNPACV